MFRPMFAAAVLLAAPFAGAQTPVQPPIEGIDTSDPGRIAEWAIAPEGAPWTKYIPSPEGLMLPEGSVLQESILLPPGTVLPGGAILPSAPHPSAQVQSDLTPDTEVGASPVADLATPGALEARSPGVPHLSGGVGASEREEMERVKGQYNLRLLFAVEGSGAYLSGVKVQIQDTAGPILLTAESDGPWFYANLAPGAYRLTLNHAGQIQARDVGVPAGGAVDQSFYWPAP